MLTSDTFWPPASEHPSYGSSLRIGARLLAHPRPPRLVQKQSVGTTWGLGTQEPPLGREGPQSQRDTLRESWLYRGRQEAQGQEEVTGRLKVLACSFVPPRCCIFHTCSPSRNVTALGNTHRERPSFRATTILLPGATEAQARGSGAGAGVPAAGSCCAGTSLPRRRPSLRNAGSLA